MTSQDHVPEPAPRTLSSGQRAFTMLVFAAVAASGLVGLFILGGIADLPPQSSAQTEAAGRPDASPVDRLAAAMEKLGKGGQPQAASSNQPQAASGGPPQAASGTPLGTVDEMTARLAERLKRNPNDPEGWRMLGWSYFNTGRFAPSAEAYAKAMALKPDNADFRSARGEALVKAADDHVTPEAKALFADALRLDAKDARARFYLGRAKAEAGDKNSALEDWIAILNEAAPDDASAPELRQRIVELSKEIGVDVSARLPRAPAAAGGGVLETLRQQSAQPATARDAGPSADDVRNAEAMAPTDRMAMIRGMVDRLASRLDQSPQDVDGWIKLIRSRKMLGEDEAARQTLQRALAVFEHEPQQQGQISAAARELGLAP
jgi:cytochrome c-type biogenesis protein CcmH